jgi:hypothetical protein
VKAAHDEVRGWLRLDHGHGVKNAVDVAWQIVDRVLKKGTVGGDVGMQLLFEPAMLLSLIADKDVLYELAEVARSIPFIGDYGLWGRASRSSRLRTGY